MSIFEGLKVIDCASFIAAPTAATLLGDLGANVIKIEPPAGDPFRALPKLPGMPRSDHPYGWMLDNRNKRGLALDLARKEGQAVVHRLVADADVFITNYPLAVRRKLAIDYDRLSTMNDRLIYASFTGYGEVGDEATKPGFDATAYWARTGLMDMVRTGAEAEPVRSMPGMGDHPSAVTLFAAIATALYRRERAVGLSILSYLGSKALVLGGIVFGIWWDARRRAPALASDGLYEEPNASPHQKKSQARARAKRARAARKRNRKR